MHLTKIVNTYSVDDPHYKVAQRLFKEYCVKVRRERMLQEGLNNYFPPVPKFRIKRITLSEVAKVALSFDVRKYVMSFAP